MIVENMKDALARIDELESLLRSCKNAMEVSRLQQHTPTDWSLMILAINRMLAK